MKYANFLEDATDDGIMLMLYRGLIDAVCCECKELNIIKADLDEFECKKCKTLQGSPLMNPEEIDKER